MKEKSTLSNKLDTKVEKKKIPLPGGTIPGEGTINPDILKVALPRDRLETGDVLEVDQQLTSKDRRFALRLQKDGNLVLRWTADGRALWSTHTEGKGGVRLSMQKDSNLVLYTAGGKPVWRTGTQGKSQMKDVLAILQNDGNFVVYDRVRFYKHDLENISNEMVETLTPLWDTGVAAKIIAEMEIDKFYRATGAEAGPLGKAVGALTHRNDGSYVREFELGEVQTLSHETHSETAGITYFDLLPRLVAIRSFGSDDPSGTDELYAVVSMINVNPNLDNEDEMIETKVFGPSKVAAGGIFEPKMNSFSMVRQPAGSGVKFHVALFDQEHGSYDKVRGAIEGKFREYAGKAATAILGAAGAPMIPGVLGNLDNDILNFITSELSGLVANWFADDLIGEDIFHFDAEEIRSWAGHAPNSMLTDPDIAGYRFNLPRDPHEGHDRWLFSNGHASYKVYFQVVVNKGKFPIVAPH
ncbi:MAG: hypothetical protein R3293_24635 [Candidatus Promineifilaceae bacterium]|nr:hypothetical protein [Candidatus Promineifilaceae bacterium]